MNLTAKTLTNCAAKVRECARPESPLTPTLSPLDKGERAGSGGILHAQEFVNSGSAIGIIWGVQLGRAERADCCLHAVSPPGRLPRAGRPAETGAVSRLGLLGQACAELRRADRAAADCRSGACGARGQPHRAHLHRRRFRRFPVRGVAPDGLLQPANLHASRRRATAVRCSPSSRCVEVG